MNVLKRDQQMTTSFAAQQKLVECCTRLLSSLEMSLNFIEHEQANKGKATTDKEWDRNVEWFRTEGPSVIGIGRSYLDKAQVDLVEIRNTIDVTKDTLQTYTASTTSVAGSQSCDCERVNRALQYVVRTYVVPDESWNPDEETTKMINYFINRD